MNLIIMYITIKLNPKYKKRGIGMFVATGAREKIISKRRSTFYENYVLPLIRESKNLDLTKSEILNMVERGYGK